MNEFDNLSVVTEIGVFGELDIDDPTAQSIKKKKKNNGLCVDNTEDIAETIAEAISENYTTLNSL